MTEAYLNGDFLSAEQVNVSVFDKGFLLGNRVYEIIPVCKGHCFKLADHLNRLQARLSGLQMTNVLWRVLVKKLIERIGGGNRALHLQIIRSVDSCDHIFPQGVTPTDFAMTKSLQPEADQ